MPAQDPRYNPQAVAQFIHLYPAILTQVFYAEDHRDAPDWILTVSNADIQLGLDPWPARRALALAQHLDLRVRSDIRAGAQRIRSAEDVTAHIKAAGRSVDQALHLDQSAKAHENRSLTGDKHLKPARFGIADDFRKLAAPSRANPQPLRDIGNSPDVIALLSVAVGDHERGSHRLDGASELHE